MPVPRYCFAYYSLSNYAVFALEITMAKVNLSRMTVEALMDLRKRVKEMLLEHRAQLEKQLEKMDVLVGGRRVVVVRGGPLRGRKVPPKYRGQSRLRESAQGDKWSFCLTAGKIGPRIRREHEQETAPEPYIGL